MRIKSQKDFFAGLMFSVVGVGFAIGASTYSIGEGARMGPGYFPLMLGIVLVSQRSAAPDDPHRSKQEGRDNADQESG